MEEQDITNFSTSSSHRLPTVSATQALEIATEKSKRTSSGLPSLDTLLTTSDTTSKLTGVPRGQITEIYGAPGVGKTALALQIAINAIHAYDKQSHVLWVSTGSPVPPRRVKQFISGYRFPSIQQPPSSPPEARSKVDVLAKLDCINALSLPRLITLFIHPTALFPPPQTTLIVVDDLSNLIHGSFPKSKGSSATPNGVREKITQKAANRKFAVLADLATAMSRMAVVNNVAILVVNQTATSLKSGQKATLKPSLSNQAWSQAVQTRILLYRDFLPYDSIQGIPNSISQQLRFAEVVKLNGRDRDYGHSPTTFVIRKGGLREINLKIAPLMQEAIPSQAELNDPGNSRKRKIEEIAGSDDEDDEIGSDDDDLGLPLVEDDDSEVEVLGDNRPKPIITFTSRGLLSEEVAATLAVRPSPRTPRDTHMKNDESVEEDDDPLTSSGDEQDEP